MKISSLLSTPGCRLRRAVTLIELMLTMSVLLVMVVAGGAFIFYSLSRIAFERNKRVATEIANSRLEQLRASGYTEISPSPADDWDSHYIKRVGGNWVFDGSNDETVNINGLILPITTTVQYVDKQGDIPPNSLDYILAIASVGYRLNTNNRVELRTFLNPYR